MASFNDFKFNVLFRKEEALPSYEAINENPRVFCAYGKSPSSALESMALLLIDSGINYWSASHVGVDEEGLYYVTIYC